MMTICGWFIFGVFAITFACAGGFIIFESDEIPWKILTGIVTAILIAALFFGIRWYFQNTASGQRALVDEKSELSNGIERTITVYTADGKVIAQYAGRIDIEGNDGGYVLFDFDGKRYTYYNCFVESVANIE